MLEILPATAEDGVAVRVEGDGGNVLYEGNVAWIMECLDGQWPTEAHTFVSITTTFGEPDLPAVFGTGDYSADFFGCDI